MFIDLPAPGRREVDGNATCSDRTRGRRRRRNRRRCCLRLHVRGQHRRGCPGRFRRVGACLGDLHPGVGPRGRQVRGRRLAQPDRGSVVDRSGVPRERVRAARERANRAGQVHGDPARRDRRDRSDARWHERRVQRALRGREGRYPVRDPLRGHDEAHRRREPGAFDRHERNRLDLHAGHRPDHGRVNRDLHPRGSLSLLTFWLSSGRAEVYGEALESRPGEVALCVHGPFRASLSFLGCGVRAMDAKRLLTFVGVGLIVIATWAAAVALAGPMPRTHIARTGAGFPVRMRAGPRGTLPAANNFYPTGIEYDSARGEVFVADAAWDNVSVVSDATNAIVANVHVGANPFGLAYDSGKGEVFVSNQVSNNVSVISDTTNAVIVASIPAGSSPQWEAYDSGKGEVFLANALSNNVTVMSDTANSVVANITVASYPAGVAYDSAKGEVFVADAFSNVVSVISDTTNTVVATIGVGGRPFGAAYDGGTGEVFVANQASNTVSVMSDATNTVVATIDVGAYPFGVAYDSAKGEVFVANANSNNVSVISDATNTVVATIAIGPVPPTYPVSFTETGLPIGTSWSVTFDGTAQSSTTNTIAFSKGNGTYSYAIGGIQGYATSPYTGTIVVNGGSVTHPVPWTQVTYSVTFQETGLPASTRWSVVLQGMSQFSMTTTDAFVEPNGTYSFTIGAGPWYTASPRSGMITVNGYSVTQLVAFSAAGNAPSISSFSASASSITLGSSVTLTVSATGTGTLSYAYSGLPPGCASVNASTLTCTPSATGAFTIRVTVTDVASRSTSASVVVTVSAQANPGGGNTIFGLPAAEGYEILAAIAIAILVGGVVVFRWRRKHKRQPPAPRSPQQ